MQRNIYKILDSFDDGTTLYFGAAGRDRDIDRAKDVDKACRDRDKDIDRGRDVDRI